MGYKYEEQLTKKFNEEYRAGRIPNLDLFNELKEVYAKAKKLDKITELIDVPVNVEQDKTMIEVNKILNEYTR